MFHRKKIHHYFAEKFLVILGIVLIWRGIWYILDYFDLLFFGQNHWQTAIASILVGFFLLYMPDKNLEEI